MASVLLAFGCQREEADSFREDSGSVGKGYVMAEFGFENAATKDSTDTKSQFSFTDDRIGHAYLFAFYNSGSNKGKIVIYGQEAGDLAGRAAIFHAKADADYTDIKGRKFNFALPTGTDLIIYAICNPGNETEGSTTTNLAKRLEYLYSHKDGIEEAKNLTVTSLLNEPLMVWDCSDFATKLAYSDDESRGLVKTGTQTVNLTSAASTFTIQVKRLVARYDISFDLTSINADCADREIFYTIKDIAVHNINKSVHLFKDSGTYDQVEADDQMIANGDAINASEIVRLNQSTQDKFTVLVPENVQTAGGPLTGSWNWRHVADQGTPQSTIKYCSYVELVFGVYPYTSGMTYSTVANVEAPKTYTTRLYLGNGTTMSSRAKEFNVIRNIKRDIEIEDIYDAYDGNGIIFVSDRNGVEGISKALTGSQQDYYFYTRESNKNNITPKVTVNNQEVYCSVVNFGSSGLSDLPYKGAVRFTSNVSADHKVSASIPGYPERLNYKAGKTVSQVSPGQTVNLYLGQRYELTVPVDGIGSPSIKFSTANKDNCSVGKYGVAWMASGTYDAQTFTNTSSIGGGYNKCMVNPKKVGTHKVTVEVTDTDTGDCFTYEYNFSVKVPKLAFVSSDDGMSLMYDEDEFPKMRLALNGVANVLRAAYVDDNNEPLFDAFSDPSSEQSKFLTCLNMLNFTYSSSDSSVSASSSNLYSLSYGGYTRYNRGQVSVTFTASSKSKLDEKCNYALDPSSCSDRITANCGNSSIGSFTYDLEYINPIQKPIVLSESDKNNIVGLGRSEGIGQNVYYLPIEENGNIYPLYLKTSSNKKTFSGSLSVSKTHTYDSNYSWQSGSDPSYAETSYSTDNKLMFKYGMKSGSPNNDLIWKCSVNLRVINNGYTSGVNFPFIQFYKGQMWYSSLHAYCYNTYTGSGASSNITRANFKVYTAVSKTKAIDADDYSTIDCLASGFENKIFRVGTVSFYDSSIERGISFYSRTNGTAPRDGTGNYGLGHVYTSSISKTSTTNTTFSNWTMYGYNVSSSSTMEPMYHFYENFNPNIKLNPYFSVSEMFDGEEVIALPDAKAATEEDWPSLIFIKQYAKNPWKGDFSTAWDPSEDYYQLDVYYDSFYSHAYVSDLEQNGLGDFWTAYLIATGDIWTTVAAPTLWRAMNAKSYWVDRGCVGVRLKLSAHNASDGYSISSPSGSGDTRAVLEEFIDEIEFYTVPLDVARSVEKGTLAATGPISLTVTPSQLTQTYTMHFNAPMQEWSINDWSETGMTQSYMTSQTNTIYTSGSSDDRIRFSAAFDSNGNEIPMSTFTEVMNGGFRVPATLLSNNNAPRPRQTINYDDYVIIYGIRNVKFKDSKLRYFHDNLNMYLDHDVRIVSHREPYMLYRSNYAGDYDDRYDIINPDHE